MSKVMIRVGPAVLANSLAAIALDYSKICAGFTGSEIYSTLPSFTGRGEPKCLAKKMLTP